MKSFTVHKTHYKVKAVLIVYVIKGIYILNNFASSTQYARNIVLVYLSYGNVPFTTQVGLDMLMHCRYAQSKATNLWCSLYCRPKICHSKMRHLLTSLIICIDSDTKLGFQLWSINVLDSQLAAHITNWPEYGRGV